MPVRFIAMDIDGTLLDSRGQVPPAHRDAIAAAQGRGIEIALVTGRGFPFTRPVADVLPAPLTLIVNNGALVKRADGETLMHRLLAADVARALLGATPDWRDSVAVIFDHPGDGHMVWEAMDWSHPNRSGYYTRNLHSISRRSTLESALTSDPVQVMFNGGVNAMRALVAQLASLSMRDRFSIAVTEYEHRDFTLVDVLAAGCSKGAMLAQWIAARGLPAADLMAVGDNFNDVEMLELAGVPVLMGNAPAALQRRGWPATGSHDEDGLATAIRRYALGAAG